MARIRGIAGALTTFLGAALLLTTAATPASAAPATEGDGWCTYRELCVYEHESGVGGIRDYYIWDSDFTDEYLFYWWGGASPTESGSSVNDTTSSAVNGDDRCQVTLHVDANWGGDVFLIPYDNTGAGFWVSDFGPYGWNDLASSNNFVDCY